METAVATPAQDLSAPIALRDVEDLHDADLDGMLTDALLDAGDAVLAHTLGSRTLFLAIR
jgi:hypothetical protein